MNKTYFFFKPGQVALVRGGALTLSGCVGYHLQASDEIIGQVCDFLMDGQTWVIRELTIKIGHRFSGKEVQIPTDKVSRISYDESTVFVNMTMEAVEQVAAGHSAPAPAAA